LWLIEVKPNSFGYYLDGFSASMKESEAEIAVSTKALKACDNSAQDCAMQSSSSQDSRQMPGA
jgi:hypothetical protein